VQCLQISGRDRAFAHHEGSILRRLTCAFERNWKIQCCAGRRKKTCESRGLHAGKALEFGDDLLLELPDVRAILVPSGANVKRDDIFSTKSRIHLGQVAITAQQQSRACEQDNCDSQLRDYQASLQPAAFS